MQTDLESMVDSARAPLQQATERIGATSPSDTPRFELFHAANSICSQKVRVVLAQHALPYTSNAMGIRTGETYLPAFVRLRMAACHLAGLPLVSSHSGSTAVDTDGCDPAVVPLLVDWQERKLIVDSKRICIHIDQAAASDARLRPAALAPSIDEELAVVDGLPNYQMLVGNAPEARGVGSSPMAGTGVKFAIGKTERCDRYLAEFSHDEALQRAYRAKRAKEAVAAEKLFSPEAMLAAYDKAEAACARLEQRLAAGRSAWLFGERATLADLFWAVELLRMKNLGAHSFWAGGALPQVSAFVQRCEAHAAIRSAVLDWPGAMF